MASDLLNDAVKRQVLQEQAPAAIRLQIMMQGRDNYDRMSNAVLGYVVSSRDWSSQARAQQPKNYGSDPMDVDAITWKGGKDAKGKSKGTGKGKPQQKDSAKETRECWICGKAGHRVEDPECLGGSEQGYWVNAEFGRRSLGRCCEPKRRKPHRC